MLFIESVLAQFPALTAATISNKKLLLFARAKSTAHHTNLKKKPSSQKVDDLGHFWA
jgi:hypothetical protein